MKKALLFAILMGSAVLPAAGTSLPSDTLKVVAFVYSPDPTTGQPQPDGTCFLLGVATIKDASKSWVYAVTNKHVLLNATTGSWFPFIWIRLNNTVGSSEMLKVSLNASFFQQNLFVSKESGVDLALIQIQPDHPASYYDFKVLPAAFLTTEDDQKQLKIAPGTDLFFVGMFSEYLGASQIEPMVRFGRVSMLPRGPVNFYGTMEDLILAEVFSFGGNSGSPVFYYLGSDREMGSIIVGSPIIKLAGIMQGYFFGNERPLADVPVASAQEKGSQSTTAEQKRTAPIFPPNSGIAAIIPAKKILDILAYEEVRQKQN